MTRKNEEEQAVVKGTVPSSLKLQFKVICTRNELKMSSVLETLINRWIQAGAPVPQPTADSCSEAADVVKGYVPKSLKLRFKVVCTQKRVKINYILCCLIHEWIEVKGYNN